MDPTIARRPRPRPAHTQGTTRCAYTSDGGRLVTVGSNNTIRLYRTGSDGEPTNIDDCQEQNLALAAASDFFVVGSEDGTVSLYSLHSASFERFLVRTSLPIRDVALTGDSQWCAVASDESTVKIVHTEDITKVKHLREHGRAARHVSFDPHGRLAALSCTNGIVYVYSLTAEEPELIRKVDGVIGPADGESEASTRAVWHPDGRAFAVPTPTKDIQLISKHDWEKQKSFANGHLADITALCWSPNGAMLASASRDGKLLIWETNTQSVIQRHDYANIVDLAWHPTSNLLSFATTDGEVYIYPDFLPDQFAPLLKLPLQAAPFIHDPLAEISAYPRPVKNNGYKDHNHAIVPRARRESLGSLASFLNGQEEDDFVVDDDGAGYVASRGNKRGHQGDDWDDYYASKRSRHLVERQCHEAFQPGSTPWRGDRKYLCLNLIGFVWTVNQESHHTVTVEFYDHEFHRNFHFTDTFLYDKACLNERGTLFSCPPRDGVPAYIFYRPHESWLERSDWRTELPEGEAVTAMSLSDSFVTVTTTSNYVRIYTLFGMPYRIYRAKSTPTVTCASWRDYVLTIGNGPVGPDGGVRLLYTIENVKRDERFQNEDTVALPDGATLKSVFFSDKGVSVDKISAGNGGPPDGALTSWAQDPCIYDSTGTLLTLLHWRQPSGASWVPLLDTRLLPRLVSGRKEEKYFPIAVADGKFHCIILKGGEQYPYFPRPLLSEFDFCIPLASQPKRRQRRRRGGAGAEGDERMANGSEEEADAGSEEEEEEPGVEKEEEEGEERERRRLEQQFMLKGVEAAQLRDLAGATSGGHSLRSELSRVELEIDKTLLQLLAAECREGEERGMRALELVGLMRDRTGRMMEMAGKVAERYDRRMLGEKIRELGEKRLAGMEDEDS